jgi:hypothetical protein
MINVIDFTDPGLDLDDEQKFILAANLHNKKIINLLGVVACLNPAEDRAKLAKGTLCRLGMNNIPVAVGTSFCGAKKCETDCEYALSVDSSSLKDASLFLYETLSQAEDNSIIFSVNSGVTDVVKFLMQHPELCKRKLKEVVIMGGVAVLPPVTVGSDVNFMYKTGPDKINYLIPDFAANNSFDYPSALFLYQMLQENDIKMCVLMREAAYAAQFPFSLYDDFANTGNVVGINLCNRQKPSILNLYKAACAPAGSEIRGKLPVDRNKQWFLNVFCGGNDPGEVEDIWPFVKGYQQYDSLAYLACSPDLRKEFFVSECVTVKGTVHEIIGKSKISHGVKNANNLRDFVMRNQIEALKNNN